ncbi:DUF6191 domain-containing protein [Kitasatospora sp. NPDC056138]|uniref:DUF6191 domain-containing protein n=1 Tax=Kitasatospora sp. NPDC056138 TaxID=3345724 RepID=UPI0035E23901
MLRLLTSPFVVLLIVVPLFLLAALKTAVARAQHRGLLPGRLPLHAEPGARGAGATATEELHALLYPGKRVQLEERRIALVLRDDEHDGAPKRTGIDLDAGTARIGRPGPQRT